LLQGLQGSACLLLVSPLQEKQQLLLQPVLLCVGWSC